MKKHLCSEEGKKREVDMQSCHNDIYDARVSTLQTKQLLSSYPEQFVRSVASVIVEIGRAKENPPKRPETDKMAPRRSRMRNF